jgi:hypothetical protein
LNGKADAEEQRKQREGFRLQGERDEALDRCIGPLGADRIWKELCEDRYPEPGDQVDRQHAEERGTAHDIDRADAFVGWNRNALAIRFGGGG